MARHVALLRGVSPRNADMAQLRTCFESAGFTNVRSVLASGNIAFDIPLTDPREIEAAAEAAMTKVLGRPFYTIVRSSAELRALLAADPYAEHGIPREAKRVVSFFREPCTPRIALPLARDQASVFLARGREAYAAYLPTDKGPVFMLLIEQAFGSNVTTRTLDTVARCAAA